jgi:hypothetical protein
VDVQVLAVKDKVQLCLVEFFGGVRVDRDGDFTVRHGSTQVFVGVRPLQEEAPGGHAA